MEDDLGHEWEFYAERSQKVYQYFSSKLGFQRPEYNTRMVWFHKSEYIYT